MSDPLKPWQETWEANRYTVDLGEAGRGPQIGSFVGDDEHTDPMSDRNRALLAAAAPDMARVLIELFNTADGPLVSKAADALEKAGVIRVQRVRVKDWAGDSPGTADE